MVEERRSLTKKLLGSHLIEGRLLPGEEISLRLDQILIQDATGVMACLQFEELGMDGIEVPLAVIYVDHNVLQIDSRNMDDHHYLQSFAARYGALYSRPGNGISHYVHLERFSRPGQLLLGADSHTPMAGALGMLAIGAGGVEVAVAMAGEGYSLECPEIVGVELRGSLPEWVQAKDVVLELLRRYGVRGGLGKIFEFFGEGARTLSASERATICNMMVETGAVTSVFPSDERVREWSAAQRREDQHVALGADPGAGYDATEEIDLSALEPLIAKPHSPGNVVPVREVAGTETVQVCIGSSVNSSYEDLALVAAVLRGAIVHPRVEMTVTPGSRQILDTIARSGVYRDLVAAGARMLEAICGPCVGVGQAPSPQEPSVRTFNRNFPGRSGTAEDEVYLCSPATAAATALRGAITDPRELGTPPAIAPAPSDPTVDERQILRPPPVSERKAIPVQKGDNIVAPPPALPVPDVISAPVTIVVGDDISTGDMAPDGVIGLSVWSNIPECAKYLFRRLDPDFYERARSSDGGIIVGGHNYGQGSSREQASLSCLYLGIRAVITKSFARIHRRNLISQGIVPLTFVREEDYGVARQGDVWTIGEVRGKLQAGDTRLLASTESGREIELDAKMLPGERQMLLAGGLIELVKGTRAGSLPAEMASTSPGTAR